MSNNSTKSRQASLKSFFSQPKATHSRTNKQEEDGQKSAILSSPIKENQNSNLNFDKSPSVLSGAYNKPLNIKLRLKGKQVRTKISQRVGFSS